MSLTTVWTVHKKGLLKESQDNQNNSNWREMTGKMSRTLMS